MGTSLIYHCLNFDEIELHMFLFLPIQFVLLSISLCRLLIQFLVIILQIIALDILNNHKSMHVILCEQRVYYLTDSA